MSQKSGCEEGLCDKTLQELQLNKKGHTRIDKLSHTTAFWWASTLRISLASRHTRLYVVLNCTVFLIPDIVFDFQMIFSHDDHPNTKSMSLAEPQNVQENNAVHIDKRGYAVHTQVSIATSQVHRVAAKRVTRKEVPCGTWLGPDPQMRTK